MNFTNQYFIDKFERINKENLPLIPSLFEFWNEGFVLKKGGAYEKRVRFKITDLHFFRNMLTNKDTFYCSGIVKDAKNHEILDYVDLQTTDQQNVESLTKKFMEILIGCALNGLYCTPYDNDRLYHLFGIKNQATCEECKKDFNGDIDAMVKHLRETKHKDSIFKKYPYWNLEEEDDDAN